MDFVPEKKSVLDIELFNQIADKKNLIYEEANPISSAEAYANAVSTEEVDYSKYGDEDGVFLNCMAKYTENGQTVSAKFKMIVHFFKKKYRLVLRSSINIAGSSASGARHQVTERISGEIRDGWANADMTCNPVGSFIVSTIIESDAPIFHKWTNINSVYGQPAEYSGFHEPSYNEKATFKGQMTIGEMLDIASCYDLSLNGINVRPIYRNIVQANDVIPNYHYSRTTNDVDIQNYEVSDYDRQQLFTAPNTDLDYVTYLIKDSSNKSKTLFTASRITTKLGGIQYSPFYILDGFNMGKGQGNILAAVGFPAANDASANYARNESRKDFFNKLNTSMKSASAFKDELIYSTDGSSSESFIDSCPPLRMNNAGNYYESMPFGNYITNCDDVAAAIGDRKISQSGWPFGMFGGGSGMVHNNFVSYRGHLDYFMSTLIDYDNNPHFNSIDDWKEYIKSKEWMNEQN